MKRRWITAALLLLFWMLALIPLSYHLHGLLTGALTLTVAPVELLSALTTIPQVRQWYLLLLICGILLILWMLFGQSHISYKSKMIHICGKIRTPEAAGQGQYGTAHWLSAKDKETVWTVIEIDRSSPVLRELLEHGQDDLEEADYEVI